MAVERPPASSEIVLARMKRQSREDTKPEVLVRKALHAAGLRYRLHYPVPENPRRKIDIAFTRAMVAVFIDGCFWHRCPIHASTPKSNSNWWINKLETNHQRDEDTNRLLKTQGWEVLRFWEHQDPNQVASTIELAVRQRT